MERSGPIRQGALHVRMRTLSATGQNNASECWPLGPLHRLQPNQAVGHLSRNHSKLMEELSVPLLGKLLES